MTFRDYKDKLRKRAGDLIEGPWRNTGVPPHVKVYEPDHEYEGEINEHHYELDPQDEFDSIPEQAASVLSDHGLSEPSMSPGWASGLWYTHPDEGGDYSGHLNGLNPQQEREVWAILQSQNDFRNRAPDAPPPGHPLDWTSKLRHTARMGAENIGPGDNSAECPYCGSGDTEPTSEQRPIPGYSRSPWRFQEYLCRQCSHHFVPGAITGIEQEEMEPQTFSHPDPWMDNEPGTETFPPEWQ